MDVSPPEVVRGSVLLWLLFVAVWVSYIPASFLAYLWAKAPVRRARDGEALRQLQGADDESRQAGVFARAAARYADLLHDFRSFAWPVTVATAVPFVTLALYLPFSRRWTLQLLDHIWPDYLGFGHSLASTQASSRMILWGFTGAFLYSFTTIWRRFMALDITPNAYTYIGIRFLSSIITGGVVGAVVGSGVATALGMPVSDRATTPICATVFIVGIFPDFGLAYLREVAKKYLGKVVDSEIETSLLEVSGINLWHESRFRQDGIENAHNLACTDLPRLVRSFPFPVSQLVDWVDESILITNIGPEQKTKFERAGVRHASTVFRAIRRRDHLAQLVSATGIAHDELCILGLSLEASSNLPLILRFQNHALEGHEELSTIRERAVSGVALFGAETG
jgi:hypothetical protein